MKKQRDKRGHSRRIEKRLARAAAGRAVVVSTMDLDAWLRSYVA
jgi:hypothetical protein